MTDPIFRAPGSRQRSALEQLQDLRALMSRATPVDAAPVEAFAANAATEFLDDAAGQAAIIGDDADAMARAVAEAAEEPVAGSSLRERLRQVSAEDIGELFRRAGAHAPAAESAAAVAGTIPEQGVAGPSLLDQLRAAAGQLRAPASGMQQAVATELAEGVVEGAVQRAPSLADRALDALRAASMVNPRG